MILHRVADLRSGSLVRNPKDESGYLIGTQDRCGYVCSMNIATGELKYFQAQDEVEFIRIAAL